MTITTPQEAFWAGQFGNDYVERNQDPRWIDWNTAYYTRLLAKMAPPAGILKLGCNRGLNLHALKRLYPATAFSAVEINAQAAAHVRRDLPHVDLHHTSILEFQPARQWDLVFTNGALIHLEPEALPKVYTLMARASARYVMISEYYNPTLVEVTYRGQDCRLFKRDSAGEFLDAHPDFKLVDYGFVYHRDPTMHSDDMPWFLMEKKAS